MYTVVRHLLVGVLMFFSFGSLSAQEMYQKVEGFYDLSGFEMSSGIYLLKDKEFFYYASFGNVDLRVYGDYTIENNRLYFHPDERLKHEFYVYGAKSTVEDNGVKITYRRPFDDQFENITINNHQVKFSKDGSYDDYSTVLFGKEPLRYLKISYPKGWGSRGEFSLKLPSETNDVLIFHNYYAKMVVDSSNSSFHIEEGVIIDQGKKYNRKKLNPTVVDRVVGFIKKSKEYKPIFRGEKEYTPLF